MDNYFEYMVNNSIRGMRLKTNIPDIKKLISKIDHDKLKNGCNVSII